jgi:dTDP-4-amino-4,6-dideoxygalactose transaminase
MEKLAINGGKPVSEKEIPIAKPIFPEKTIRDISEVLQSGHIIQGPKTAQFEEEFRKRIGAKYAYAVNSGTAALHTAYASILKPGDEVIVPGFTFIATASTVIFARGKPVFADIDGETLTIDPEDVKEKISSKTKAVAPVHLFGNAADMKALSEIADEYDLYLVNDAAQAHGTKVNEKDVGVYDDLNCYSFYPSKTLTTSEGGMVTTNSKKLYEKGLLFRNHGQQTRYLSVTLGLNYRLTDIAAAIGLNQLKLYDEFLAKRKRNAKALAEGLRRNRGLKPQKPGKGVDHSYSYYTVIMDLEQYKCTRDEFVNALKAENIGCIIYYPIPLSKQPALKRYGRRVKCPVADDLSKKVFSIPVHPNLSNEDLEKIVEALEKVSSHFQK